MSTYTAGELYFRGLVNESVYGTIPTGTLSPICGNDMISIDNTTNMNVDYHTLSGSRTFGVTTMGPYDAGFKASFYCRATASDQAWFTQLWLYSLGTLGTVSDRLGSFTFVADAYDDTTHQYLVWNGCKINRLTIKLDKVGTPIVFEVEVFSQYFQTDSDKSLTGIQTVTVGSDSTATTSAVLTWAGNSTINIAGGGATTYYPLNQQLVIDNHLERRYGIRTGGDSAAYPVPVAMLEGKRDIIYTAEIHAADSTYTEAKRAKSLITAIALPIGAQTVTLANGYMQADDFGSFTQDINKEKFAIRFPTISYA